MSTPAVDITTENARPECAVAPLPLDVRAISIPPRYEFLYDWTRPAAGESARSPTSSPIPMLRSVQYDASLRDGVSPDDVLPKPAVATIHTRASPQEHWAPHVDPSTATQTKVGVDASPTVSSHIYSRIHASRAVSHPSSRTTIVSPAQAAAARDVCIVQTARRMQPANTKRAKATLATARTTPLTGSSDHQDGEDAGYPPLRRGGQELSASAPQHHPPHTGAAPQLHHAAQAVPQTLRGNPARNKKRRTVPSAPPVSATHIKTEATSPPPIPVRLRKFVASSLKNVRTDYGEQSASAPGPVRKKRAAHNTRSPAASSSRRVVPKLEDNSHASLPASMSTDAASLPLFRASRNEERKATQSTKRVHYFETCPLVDSFAERSVTCKACGRTIRLDGEYLPGKWWAHLRRDDSCINRRVVMVESGDLPESVLALKDVRGRKKTLRKTRVTLMRVQ